MSFDMMFLDESPKTLDDAGLETLTKKMGTGGHIPGRPRGGRVQQGQDFRGQHRRRRARSSSPIPRTTSPANYDVLERQKKESFKKAQKRFFDRALVEAVAGGAETARRARRIPNTKSISYPIPEFMNTARSFGFVNRDTDIDGTVRKVQAGNGVRGTGSISTWPWSCSWTRAACR